MEIKHCATRKNKRLYKLRWKGIQDTVKQSSEQGVEHGKICLSNRSEIWFYIINIHLNILPIGDEAGNRRWTNTYISFLRVLVFWAMYVLHTHTHTHTHRYKSKCNGLYTYLSNLVTILNLKNIYIYLFIWLPWALFAALGLFTVACGVSF